MTTTKLPWKDDILKDWSIVGMNHYHVNGERRLFVSMTKGLNCITEEGIDDLCLWERLKEKATTLNTPTCPKEILEALDYVNNYLKKGGFGRVDCQQKIETIINKYNRNEKK